MIKLSLRQVFLQAILPLIISILLLLIVFHIMERELAEYSHPFVRYFLTGLVFLNFIIGATIMVLHFAAVFSRKFNLNYSRKSLKDQAFLAGYPSAFYSIGRHAF